MTQDLIVYAIVILSALYLARRAVRRKGGACCEAGRCAALRKR